MNASDLPDEALFEAAVNCRTPAERIALLDQACAGRPALRRHIEVLLAANCRQASFVSPAFSRPGFHLLPRPRQEM